MARMVARRICRSALGEAGTTSTLPKRHHRTDRLADPAHELRADLGRIAGDSRLEYREAAWHLTFQVVADPDDRSLGDVRVSGDHLFDLARRQPVPGDVDDVVDAAHHVQVAVGVLVAAIAGQVVAGESGEVALDVTVVVLPQRRHRSGRQGQPDDDGSFRVRRDLFSSGSTTRTS